MKSFKKEYVIDINNVAFNGVSDVADIMALFQDAVTDHTQILGVDAPNVRQKLGAKWVITRVRFEINKRPSLADKCEVTTWPLAAKAIRFGRCFTLDCNGERLVNAYTEWCLLDCDTDEVIRANRLSMPIDEYMAEVVTQGKFSMAKEEFYDDDVVYSRTMRASDIDLNRHVNNVSYIRLALDCFTTDELENMNFDSFEMYYVSQCYEAQTLTLYRKGNCIEARRDGDTVFRCTFNV